MLGFWIAKQKCIFPLSKTKPVPVEKCIRQARYDKTTQQQQQQEKKKNTVKGALIVAHFQEDQTKYQPSQTRSPLCKDAHPKSQAAGWNTRNISCLRCGMPNSGKGLLEKAGRIYMLEKNSFICVKSILKNNPCNQLTLRLDLLVRLKGKSKPLCVWVQLVGQYFVHAPCEWPKVPYSRFAHND